MVAPLVALNALTQGTGPTVHVAPDTSDNKLGVLHEDCMRDGHCLVVGLGDDSEVVLAPVQTHKGDGAHALFWGYCILRGVVSCGSLLFENGGQLPAVFDLDETLVLANSGHNLGQRLEAASRQMQDLHDQLECCTVKEEREKLQAQIAAVEHEQVLLREDHQMVQSYAESNKVEVNGQVYHAREETVESGNGVTSRPIIRIPEAGLVLTRIDSSKPETSMVIRIRPGWENLRAYLSGQMENKRQKWKVFVCTAAEREYAHEAWRLLDTAGDLIPAAERPSRIFSGARKKSLMHTLKLGPFSPEPLPAHCVSGMNIAPLVEGVSEMPLALIIDDRLDVWDRRNRSQIVQVTPYLHYKSHKSSEKIPKYDANELLRVKYIFQSLRADLYFSLCEKMTKALAAMMAQGVPDKEKLMKLLADTPTFAVVLDQVVSKPYPPPEEQTNDLKRDESNHHNGISLKPQDPRQQPPTQRNVVPAQGQLLPQDPRSQKPQTNSTQEDPTIGPKCVDDVGPGPPEPVQSSTPGGVGIMAIRQGPESQPQLGLGNKSAPVADAPRPVEPAVGLGVVAPSSMTLSPLGQNPGAGLPPTDPRHVVISPAHLQLPNPVAQTPQQQGTAQPLQQVGQFQPRPGLGQIQASMPMAVPMMAPPMFQFPPNQQMDGKGGFQFPPPTLMPLGGPPQGQQGQWPHLKRASLDAPLPMPAWNLGQQQGSSEKQPDVQQILQPMLPALTNLSTSMPEARFADSRPFASGPQVMIPGVQQMMQSQAPSPASAPEPPSNLPTILARGLVGQPQSLGGLLPLQSQALAGPMVPSGPNFLPPNVAGIQQTMVLPPARAFGGPPTADIRSQGGNQLVGVQNARMLPGSNGLPTQPAVTNNQQVGQPRAPFTNFGAGAVSSMPQPMGTMESQTVPQQGVNTVAQPEALQQVPFQQSLHPLQQQAQDPRVRQAFFGNEVRQVLVPGQPQHLQVQPNTSILPMSNPTGAIYQPGPGPQQLHIQARPPMHGGIVGVAQQQQQGSAVGPVGAAPVQVLTPQGVVSIAPSRPGLPEGGPYIALQTPNGIVLFQSQGFTPQALPSAAQKETPGTSGPPVANHPAGSKGGSTMASSQKHWPAVAAPSLPTQANISAKPQQPRRPVVPPKGPPVGRNYIQTVMPGAGGTGFRVVPEGRSKADNWGQRQPVQKAANPMGESTSCKAISSTESWKHREGKNVPPQSSLRNHGVDMHRSLSIEDGEDLSGHLDCNGPYEALQSGGSGRVTSIDLGPRAANPSMRYKAELMQRLPNGATVKSEGWGPSKSAAKQAAIAESLKRRPAAGGNLQPPRGNTAVDDRMRDRDRDKRGSRRDPSPPQPVKRTRHGHTRPIDRDSASTWGSRGNNYGQASLTGYVAQLADGLDDADEEMPLADDDDEEEEGEIK